MAQRKGRVVIIICTLVFVIACSSERAIVPSLPDLGPTPYTLEIPTWATDSIHTMYVPSDNPLTVEGIALGRRLFYEKALSRDGTLACSSCHIQEHAFSDPRRFSMGIEGDLGHRNSMALMNLAWGHFFFWDARAMSLELQALEPVNDHREMFNAWPEVLQRLRDLPGYAAQFDAAFGTMEIDSLHVSFALAQFERTLISFDSPFDRFQYGCDSTALTPAEIRGKELFFGGAHCVDCHEPPLFADHDMINIGLDSMPTDKGLGERTGLYRHFGLFKTPALRNIAASAPYMHDGRFATLEEVVDFYADDVHLNTPNFHDHMFAWKLGVVKLDAQERKDLVTFLQALTDSTFLHDPRFSDPRQ
ncbi:MAG: c-type cytochrome [Flavobacteriales bacterium]|jgi:cytochrome c peroxidase|nr:c-type cytochrome [Flavobacteriales bacterium]HQW41226.1 cytochrome c peroxidase [Flavobacteriales bacterium]